MSSRVDGGDRGYRGVRGDDDGGAAENYRSPLGALWEEKDYQEVGLMVESKWLVRQTSEAEQVWLFVAGNGSVVVWVVMMMEVSRS